MVLWVTTVDQERKCCSETHDVGVNIQRRQRADHILCRCSESDELHTTRLAALLSPSNSGNVVGLIFILDEATLPGSGVVGRDPDDEGCGHVMILIGSGIRSKFDAKRLQRTVTFRGSTKRPHESGGVSCFAFNLDARVADACCE